MIVCKRCVMDTTDPNISFDEKGVCSYCNSYMKNEQKIVAQRTNLPWVYHKIRSYGRGKKYDCLLGLSGGVDSSLCLHYLVENGIRPLCFSVDNGWNTHESDENIMNLVEGLKVPFYRYVINLKKFKELQLAFIESGTTNIEIPTDHILTAAAYELANKYNIKYIISGGNTATESIMPESYGYNARDLTFLKDVYYSSTGKKLEGLPTYSLFQYIINRFIKKIEIVNLLDFYEYNRENAIGLLGERYGYMPYGEKHCESVFTKWFQNYWLLHLFGIDKRKPHYSSLINSKQMTRNEALFLLDKQVDFPKIDLSPRITDGNYVGSFIRRSYKDFKNSEYWWNILSKYYAIFTNRK